MLKFKQKISKYGFKIWYFSIFREVVDVYYVVMVVSFGVFDYIEVEEVQFEIFL